MLTLHVHHSDLHDGLRAGEADDDGIIDRISS
jgi:hypothetical protein